jgi:predicted tellurium resistance membrane protein TerC
MNWVVPLVSLAGMEIVLGIDNIIFLAVLAGRLPEEKQPLARRLGLGLALVSRLLLLFTLNWILGLSKPLFHLSSFLPEGWLTDVEVDAVSVRDLILIVGGFFLVMKSTREIHQKLEGRGDEHAVGGEKASMAGVLVQIALLDIVFSLDSVISAVGMVREVWIMATAMVIAVVVMLIFAGPISAFVHRHPTLKMLAMSFLILIGFVLVTEGLGTHINKGYIYTAMAFSLAVEMLNLRAKAKAKAKAPPPIELREPPPVSDATGVASRRGA